MPPPLKNSVAQRRVGLELRRLRSEAGRTLSDVATAMEWSIAKLSRVENGEGPILGRDVRFLCDMLDAEPGVADALVELVRQARTPGWWEPYRNVLGNNYIPFEASATEVHEFQLELICGLLQTPPYTRAIMRQSAREDTEDQLEQRVELRQQRQAALRRGDKPLRLWTVLSEGALLRQVGSPDIMQAQLLHLVDQSERPNIDVQILPFTATERPPMGTTFMILHFEAGDPLVFSGGISSVHEVEEPRDQRRALVAFDRLRAAAASPEDSRRIIMEAAKAVS
ncbi:helix-turn-helix domain-containing protein [Pseudonocardia spinosispora]|uniref:helix-turn-helix domain-containing protein n=1 Tax=Pseudonocardia spinosispora TaxID=103441 RepID=UPI00055D49CA|nr:helix-turn-helix transcriptional regulator [Pseudonocardia spinosispora]